MGKPRSRLTNALITLCTLAGVCAILLPLFPGADPKNQIKLAAIGALLLFAFLTIFAPLLAMAAYIKIIRWKTGKEPGFGHYTLGGLVFCAVYCLFQFLPELLGK